MNKFAVLIALVLAVSIVSAAQGTLLTGLTKAINDLCVSLKSLLPVAGMLMIMVAGVIYASGQVMGAETRARANVWATAALTGALIAILIVVVAPPVLKTIYVGSGSDTGWSDPNSGFCMS